VTASVRHRYKRIRRWFAQPGGRGDIAAALGVFAILVLGALYVLDDNIDDERRSRGQERAEDRQRVDRIDDRTLRLERDNPRACRQSPRCRAVVVPERDQGAARQRPKAPERRQRRERPDQTPEQVADRPPRVVAPPAAPELQDGGDDPPPPPTSTPADTPSPSPAPVPQRGSSILEVDVGPVDIDGSDGLAPELLPDVNLPPVDLPPIRLP
jgi:hypothetical protein